MYNSLVKSNDKSVTGVVYPERTYYMPVKDLGYLPRVEFEEVKSDLIDKLSKLSNIQNGTGAGSIQQAPIGNYTASATGDGAVALGKNVISSGNTAFTIGQVNNNSGAGAFLGGNGCTNTGNYAFMFSYNSKNYGPYNALYATNSELSEAVSRTMAIGNSINVTAGQYSLFAGNVLTISNAVASILCGRSLSDIDCNSCVVSGIGNKVKSIASIIGGETNIVQHNRCLVSGINCQTAAANQIVGGHTARPTVKSILTLGTKSGTKFYNILDAGTSGTTISGEGRWTDNVLTVGHNINDTFTKLFAVTFDGHVKSYTEPVSPEDVLNLAYFDAHPGGISFATEEDILKLFN